VPTSMMTTTSITGKVLAPVNFDILMTGGEEGVHCVPLSGKSLWVRERDARDYPQQHNCNLNLYPKKLCRADGLNFALTWARNKTLSGRMSSGGVEWDSI
jgi:hypothetical protein